MLESRTHNRQFTRKKRAKQEDLLKAPFFYFGTLAFMLLGFLFLSSDSLAQMNYMSEKTLTLARGDTLAIVAEDVFLSQRDQLGKETPDLKLIENDFIYGISTPRVVTSQTLGDIFGETVSERKEVEEYAVQPGDTVDSLATQFNISVNTILWANKISRNTPLKVGQTLVMLPVSGLLHAVKSGDTISQLARTYKSNADDIAIFNETGDEVFIGDILVIPGGIMPVKVTPAPSYALSVELTPLPDSFFIAPLVRFKKTQGLHYFNGIDLAATEGCGSPVYAAASGTIQRAVGNGKWNLGMGNHVTILHAGGISSYYGHLAAVFVKPGDAVSVGDRIGSEGKTGKATGCHVHFQVMGAKNPFGDLVKYPLGAIINLSK